MKAIRKIESSGNPRAVRFETRLFHEKTGTTIEGHARAQFEQASLANPVAAMESTSFGLYQVLGRALIELYGSPARGLAAFDANPRDVSDRLLVKWFQGRPAAREAANTGDYHELALRYNGSATSPWYTRFMLALEEVSTTGSGGLAAMFLALGLGWAAWRVWR
jgi:hypothetical protein